MRSTYEAFYALQPGDTVSGVIAQIHGMSPREVARYLPAIAANNPHIANLDRVRPGQMIDVSLQSHDPSMAQHRRTDMEEMERIYGSLSPTERTYVTENAHVGTTLLGLMPDAVVNVSDAAAYTLGQLVGDYAQATKIYGAALTQNFAAGARGTLQSELQNMVTLRQPVKQALDRIPKFVQELMLEEARRIPQPMRFSSTGISKQVLRLAPKNLGQYNPFSTVLGKYANVVKGAKLAGVGLSIAIPVGIAGYKSAQAYGTPEFGRVTAGGIGNVAGGLMGSAIGYGACTFIFAAPTAGTSVFWCGILVGGVVGMGLSSGLQSAGEGVYDAVTGAPPLPNVSESCSIPML